MTTKEQRLAALEALDEIEIAVDKIAGLVGMEGNNTKFKIIRAALSQPASGEVAEAVEWAKVQSLFYSKDKTESAFSIDVEKMKERQQQHIFEYMARDFFKRWQPENPQEAHAFSAELFCLVRRIYMDAQEPAMSELIKVLKLLPVVYGGITNDHR